MSRNTQKKPTVAMKYFLSSETNQSGRDFLGSSRLISHSGRESKATERTTTYCVLFCNLRSKIDCWGRREYNPAFKSLSSPIGNEKTKVQAESPSRRWRGPITLTPLTRLNVIRSMLDDARVTLFSLVHSKSVTKVQFNRDTILNAC